MSLWIDGVTYSLSPSGGKGGEGREDMQIHTYSLSPSPTHSNLEIVMCPDP